MTMEPKLAFEQTTKGHNCWDGVNREGSRGKRGERGPDHDWKIK